ncbi:MAG: phage major capsid protein [Acidimicrobiaceae bacterium]|nr:phage major capsid protein [Acidimicrobiaceae bacterium]
MAASGLEVELRAALAAEADGSAPATASAADGTQVPHEDRERIDLRSRCSLGGFLSAAVTGRPLTGAEAELASELNLGTGSIPHEMLTGPDKPVEHRADAPTLAPGTVGVSLMAVVPSIFARSVVPRLGIEMPRVPSGTYGVPRITTDLTAGAVAKGAAQGSTAAALTVATTTPHRVAARLSIALEDVAAIGTDSFGAALRQNLMLALSARLDLFALNGDGTGANPQGLIGLLTDPTDVVDWAGFVGALAGGIDGGPWAESMMDVSLLVNAETMRLAEQTFRGPASVGTSADTYSDTPGEMSAAAYLRAHSGGVFASSRMPDTSSAIAACIRYRSGTMGLDGVDAMMTAACPVWSEVAIDDPYTDAASGQRHFTLTVLVGDVILTQPSAYERVDLKVA